LKTLASATQSGTGPASAAGASSNRALIESINPPPANASRKLRPTDDDYEHVMAAASMPPDSGAVPAPKRGEAIRLMAEELRLHKDRWAAWFRSRTEDQSEGDGEVQEMIDIADLRSVNPACCMA